MIKDFNDLTSEQRAEWIKSLQVGDSVVIRRTNYGYGYSDTYVRGKVIKITPTGRINVETGDNKYTFTNDGKYYGNRGDAWSRVSYQLRMEDEFYRNHKRKVINQTIFEESMKKLVNSYNTLKTVEEIEQYAYVIDKALKELNL